MNRFDLMIGDWVIAQPDEDICGEGVGTIIGRITEIYDVEGVMSVSLEDFDYPVAIGLLEPLRISPEMLEKWGFKKKDGGQWVIEKKHPIGCCGQTCSNTNPLEYAVWVDSYGIGAVSYLDAEGNTNIGLKDVRYVHILQHILHLYGLDEYIKIEV